MRNKGFENLQKAIPLKSIVQKLSLLTQILQIFTFTWSIIDYFHLQEVNELDPPPALEDPNPLEPLDDDPNPPPPPPDPKVELPPGNNKNIVCQFSSINQQL